MQENWRAVCAYASSIYMLLIFGGQAYMANRPGFELRGLLTAWNIMLAVFSIMGASRNVHLYLMFVQNRVCGFWTWMFVLSKVPELGDTVFIVFRKQQLIFLHWYHHVTVLLYAWYSYTEYTAPARWFIVMNYIVHSIMYSYYACKALRVRVPRCIAMLITSLQLLQMVIGCTVNFLAFQYKQNGVECGVSDNNLKLSLIMYTSYFVLFARFFYNAYLIKSQRKELKTESVDAQNNIRERKDQ
ncbi:elongation of very long chain fatty acids protein 6 [Eurytemora carolleeae]|uniref:elongation of very long chain fatty acids protein 6 n=1 Tax=Eurytemora carolleeae TaxID=1294199 RepID=UPI000C7752F3|nr:elongation of very long chain fatty acids protein 6 [Eurytemora carolleeae]|eukprot:XP_023334075.1 elongation of very long chain fatty acids protein 6-like [Eurytemora affinis]